MKVLCARMQLIKLLRKEMCVGFSKDTYRPGHPEQTFRHWFLAIVITPCFTLSTFDFSVITCSDAYQFDVLFKAAINCGATWTISLQLNDIEKCEVGVIVVAKIPTC